MSTAVQLVKFTREQQLYVYLNDKTYEVYFGVYYTKCVQFGWPVAS